MTEGAGARIDDANQQAGDAAGNAKAKAEEATRDQVEQRSDQAGERVASTAEDVRAVGDTLRERGNDTAARLAEQAADYAQKLADYLRGSSADKIIADVEGYARRQPWAVVAGGVLVGFAASRLVRASARHDHDTDEHAEQGRHSDPSASDLPYASGEPVVASVHETPAEPDRAATAAVPLTGDDALDDTSEVSRVHS